MKTKIKSLIGSLLLLSLVSCQVQDDSPISGSKSSHPVNINLSSYSTASVMNYLIPSAYANVSELKACFKRLRFKKDISDSTIEDHSSGDDDLTPHEEDNIDFNIGEVTLTDSGTLLGTVNVPEGTYYRIEFDLEPSCAGGKSLSLSNDFGVFSSNEKIKIKFDGVFVVNGPEAIELGVQDILNAANAYNGTAPMEDVFESISGSL